MVSLLLFPVGSQAGKVVTAKGLSFFEPGREAIAREKALDEAKRSAVEKAVGTTIESRTAVEDYQVVKDQILSRSAGYLKNINILEEKKTDLGTYEVTIEAEVEIPALVDDLDRFKKIVKWQKNPRISVSIGVACVVPDPNHDFTALLDRADKALSMAKERGRNRMHLSS